MKVLSEKATAECGDSESSLAGVMGWSWGKSHWRKGNVAGCFPAFCCKRTEVGEALRTNMEIQLISIKLTLL